MKKWRSRKKEVLVKLNSGGGGKKETKMSDEKNREERKTLIWRRRRKLNVGFRVIIENEINKVKDWKLKGKKSKEIWKKSKNWKRKRENDDNNQ